MSDRLTLQCLPVVSRHTVDLSISSSVSQRSIFLQDFFDANKYHYLLDKYRRIKFYWFKIIISDLRFIQKSDASGTTLVNAFGSTGETLKLFSDYFGELDNTASSDLLFRNIADASGVRKLATSGKNKSVVYYYRVPQLRDTSLLCSVFKGYLNTSMYLKPFIEDLTGVQTTTSVPSYVYFATNSFCAYTCSVRYSMKFTLEGLHPD